MSPTPPPTTDADACGIAAQKEFVLDIAQDWYLWYREMANIDPEAFDSAEEFLTALTEPLAEDFRDPGFSYLTTQAEDEANFTDREFIGFGFRFGIDAAGRYVISDTFEGSPAAQAGFARGTEMVAIDTGDGFETLTDLTARGATLDEIFGAPLAGVSRRFRLRAEGIVQDVIVEKDRVSVAPIASAPIFLTRGGLAPVGYVHLRDFTIAARQALSRTFAELSDAGITDLIVDLRYNSGGLVDVSSHLMNLLGGSLASGEVSYRRSHNDKRLSENVDFFFERLPETIEPLRIAFLTGEATASASEVVINSLAPVVELVLVGSDTTGKAVGQYAFDQPGCDTRLRLVAFESLNGAGLGGYYTGLVDTGRFTLCAVEDDFRGAFGTREDALTAGALAWLNGGTCPQALIASDESGAQRGLRRAGFPIRAANRADRLSQWVQ